MGFVCPKCLKEMRHRGGESYWCKTCKAHHTIRRLETPQGTKFIIDPVVMNATEEQKEDFKKWAKDQGLKEPGVKEPDK